MNVSHSEAHGPILFHGKIGPLLKSVCGGVSKSCDYRFGIECNKKRRTTENNILSSAAALRSLHFPLRLKLLLSVLSHFVIKV